MFYRVIYNLSTGQIDGYVSSSISPPGPASFPTFDPELQGQMTFETPDGSISRDDKLLMAEGEIVGIEASPHPVQPEPEESVDWTGLLNAATTLPELKAVIRRKWGGE